jgi:hypothetical protein
MDTHKLKHGDVVVGQTGVYRLYVRTVPDHISEGEMRCISLLRNKVYIGEYSEGQDLADGETFVFNLITICASST